jgi:tRNA(Ile)-lysidine synthase
VSHDLRHSIERVLRPPAGGATVLAAVSGGPDSMAMLDALCVLSRRRSGFSVVAAHFDHRLRPDSSRDRDVVSAFVASRGIRFVCGEGDVRASARATRRSVEEAARDLRYAFLERAADEAGADAIAVAHTRDDQIETALMRILRGTGIRGLAGIPERRGRIVRPLLSVARAETIAYCREHGVPFVIDSTNDDRRFLRNRIRHDVLPALRRAYPGIDEAFLRMAASARVELERIDRLVAGRIESLRRTDANEFALDASAFFGLEDDERVQLLSRALETMSAGRDVSRVHYRSLLRLSREDARPGGSVDLPGLRARREHDAIVFFPRARREGESPGVGRLPVPGRVVIGGWEVSADVVPGEVARAEIRKAAPASHDLIAFLGHNDRLPAITVRLPRPGDRMRPFGMSGHKKLSDLFIDGKVPRRMRARTPVVEMNGEIVWVAGVAASESSRIGATTSRAIRLRARRIDATPARDESRATAAAEQRA